MVQIDKGPLPNPGGSTGHASNFIFPTDHNKEMAFLTLESQQQYIDHGLNNTSGGIEVARKPERMEEFKRRMTSAKAWGIDSRSRHPGGDQGAGPVHQRGDPPRRLLHTERLVRRLAGDRHADAQRGRRRRCAAGVRQHRGARRRDRGWPRRPEGRRRPHQQGSHRSRVRRDRLRRVEPADRQDGRCQHPAHSCGPPDGRRRPDRHPPAEWQGGRLPDRSRHGHVLLRASDRRFDGGRLVRPPSDLHAPRRHSVQRGIGAVADRVAVHRRRLRPAVRRGHRSDGHARRGRDPLRDQRSVEPDARRQPGPRRDGGSAQPVERCRGVDQGRPRHRPDRCRVDDLRLPAPVRPAQHRHQPVLPAREDRASHPRPLRRALQQDVRHRPPARAVGQPARHAPQPVLCA